MENAKKNYINKVANLKEQARTEQLTQIIIQEEQRVDNLVKHVQTREFEEIP